MTTRDQQMIPKQAIEKAIEGGWSAASYSGDDTVLAWLDFEAENDWQKFALDPTFWQALGTALGWDEGNINRPSYADSPYVWMWQHIAHEFVQLILTGGDTKHYWQDLLK